MKKFAKLFYVGSTKKSVMARDTHTLSQVQTGPGGQACVS